MKRNAINASELNVESNYHSQRERLGQLFTSAVLAPAQALGSRLA